MPCSKVVRMPNEILGKARINFDRCTSSCAAALKIQFCLDDQKLGLDFVLTSGQNCVSVFSRNCHCHLTLFRASFEIIHCDSFAFRSTRHKWLIEGICSWFIH
jgi:hypothetical protein